MEVGILSFSACIFIKPKSSKSFQFEVNFFLLPAVSWSTFVTLLFAFSVCMCVEGTDETSLLFKNSQIRHSAKVAKEWDALPVVQRPGNSFVSSSFLSSIWIAFEISIPKKSLLFSSFYSCWVLSLEVWVLILFCETPWNTGKINILLFLWLPQNVF